MTNRQTILTRYGIVAAILGAACVAAPGAEPSTDLGTRYVDSLNGYSLRPPANTTRRKEYSQARLASWTRRDTKSGAIDLTLVTFKRTAIEKKVNLKAFAEGLRVKLAREQQLFIYKNKLRITTVGGKKAIDLTGEGSPSGPAATKLGLWQRQVWIQVAPRDFLIIAISGPKARMSNLDTVFTKVLTSVELIDPAEAIRTRNANLKRGQDLLAGLTAKKLTTAFNGRAHWYLFRKDDKDVGYMVMKAFPARRESADGFEILSVVRLQLPKDKIRRSKREQFATTDRTFSRWQESMNVGSGATVMRYVEDGMKQGDVALCRISAAGQERTNQQRLTPAMQKTFLPRAFGMVLPRLVDLKQKQAYAFAMYNSQANGFDMRTFTIGKPETITISARRVETVHIIDRTAEDAEPTNVWVNASGDIVRMTTPDGLAMEASTQNAVARRFPDDEASLRRMR